MQEESPCLHLEAIDFDAESNMLLGRLEIRLVDLLIAAAAAQVLQSTKHRAGGANLSR